MKTLFEKYMDLIELTLQRKKEIDDNVNFINITKYIKLYVLNKISFDKLFRVIKSCVEYDINKNKLKSLIDDEIKKYNYIKDRHINPITLAIVTNE